MTFPIPIPDPSGYGHAIFVVYSLGAASFAASMGLIGGLRRFSFLQLYLAVLTGATAWGFLILPAGVPDGGSLQSIALFAGLGAVLGVAAMRCDRAIVRRSRLDAVMRDPSVLVGVSLARRATAAPGRQGVKPAAPSGSAIYGAGALAGLIAVAALEELVFRGFYTRLCLGLPNLAAAALGLVAVTLFFATLHIRFGWIQVLAKAPLGVLALGVTLASGNIIPAIVLHATFNLGAWRTMRA